MLQSGESKGVKDGAWGGGVILRGDGRSGEATWPPSPSPAPTPALAPAPAPAPAPAFCSCCTRCCCRCCCSCSSRCCVALCALASTSSKLLSLTEPIACAQVYTRQHVCVCVCVSVCVYKRHSAVRFIKSHVLYNLSSN